MFIKVFNSELEAIKFAQLKNAKVSIHYEYNELTKSLVRLFVVKY